MQITVKGKPIAKARPRFARAGNFVKTYNDQETEEGRWLWEAREQLTKQASGPIAVNMRFFMPIPKSTSKKKREMLCYHSKKPDIDNLIKFACDCLNGMAWEDDSQISEIEASKIYSENPRTVIEVEDL